MTYPREQSGLECPECHSKIFSNSRHDFVECKCKKLYIDGGFDYLRYGGIASPSAIRVSRTLERQPPPYFAQERK